jgi:hypothetical protein
MHSKCVQACMFAWLTVITVLYFSYPPYLHRHTTEHTLNNPVRTDCITGCQYGDLSDWVRFVSSTTQGLNDEDFSCKIRGLHGSDYEECRLLGCRKPVRTSQETHYISATESSRLMLCKI